jgi:hypothetical protein
MALNALIYIKFSTTVRLYQPGIAYVAGPSRDFRSFDMVNMELTSLSV